MTVQQLFIEARATTGGPKERRQKHSIVSQSFPRCLPSRLTDRCSQTVKRVDLLNDTELKTFDAIEGRVDTNKNANDYAVDAAKARVRAQLHDCLARVLTALAARGRRQGRDSIPALGTA